MFSEGWIEFSDKRIAKRVALSLNNTQVGGKKRSPYYADLWNIKYLHRFKWSHLSDQLENEKTVRQHRIRADIRQAKKETDFYKRNVEKKKMFEEMGKKKKLPRDQQQWTYRQRETEEEILKKRKLNTDAGENSAGQSDDHNVKKIKRADIPEKARDHKSFLKHLFSGGVKEDLEDS